MRRRATGLRGESGGLLVVWWKLVELEDLLLLFLETKAPGLLVGVMLDDELEDVILFSLVGFSLVGDV